MSTSEERQTYSSMLEPDSDDSKDTHGWTYDWESAWSHYRILSLDVRVEQVAEDSSPVAWRLTAAAHRDITIGYYPTEGAAMDAGEELLANNGKFNLVTDPDTGEFLGVRNPYPRNDVDANQVQGQ